MENFDAIHLLCNSSWINIGSGEEVSIRYLANTIADIAGYTDLTVWETNYPNGVRRRLLDCSRLHIRSEEYSVNQWQQHYFPQSQFQTLVEEAWLTDKEVLYVDYANGPLYPIKSGYEWLLLPSEEYYALAQKKAHGVITGEYVCLHVRTGDDDYVHDVDRYVGTIKEMVKEYRQIVVVCDNQMLKNALPQDILQSPASPKHSKEMPKEGIVDWLVDLKLICGAKEIISICDFPWGSTGFSKLPAEIHGIPYSNIQPKKYQ